MWIWNVNCLIYILNRIIFFHKTCSMYYRWMTLFWSMGECGDHRPSCCFTRLSTPWWRCSGHIFIYNIYAYIYYYYHYIYITFFYTFDVVNKLSLFESIEVSCNLHLLWELFIWTWQNVKITYILYLCIVGMSKTFNLCLYNWTDKLYWN